jgi:hypothetical protein
LCAKVNPLSPGAAMFSAVQVKQRNVWNLIQINPFVQAMEKQAKFLQEQAERCRRLANQLTDRELAQTLLALGEDYAQKAMAAWDAALAGRAPADRTSSPPRPSMPNRH